ncbi:MAG: shikimate kinase [Lachnospiraceae bacterium]|nr:shikimate kinase [Lachnospiraceae bacterium]
MEERNNIILIGMPASGKSTVGVILAKILGMDFVDTDIVIQQREGARLNEIIDAQGVKGFLEKEEQALFSINASHTVIATGGSAVYSDPGMKYLSEGSKTVYLKVELEDLKKRLKDIKLRGVVLRSGESLETMYENRARLYEKYADISIAEQDGSIEDTVQAVLHALK